MTAKTETIFLKDCTCGARIEIRPRQAGTQLSCTECRTDIAIESLSALHSLRSIDKKLASKPPPQITISFLMSLFIPFAIVAWIVDFIGWKLSQLIGMYLATYLFAVLAVTYLIHYTPICLLYTSPSPRDLSTSRMPSSA